MQRGRQMTALRGWCTSPSVTANPPFQSRQAQLESGVRGNVPAPFGAGERLQSPTYRYLGGSNPARLPGHGETCRQATRPVPTQSGTQARGAGESHTQDANVAAVNYGKPVSGEPEYPDKPWTIRR